MDDPPQRVKSKRVIVLATLGTLGDLYPFIAIALALKDSGFDPVLAVARDHLKPCRDAGLKAVAIHPGFEAISDRMGLSHQEAVCRIVGDQRVMLEQVLLADLPACAAALDAACHGADAIVGSIFVFAAAMIAEKRNLPLISVVLQPMAMLSESDPPHTPDFWMMKGAASGPLARTWNRFAYSTLRLILQTLYGRRIDAVRRSLGLLPGGATRMLEPAARSILRLGCYSGQLGVPADLNESTRIVGFPMFDGANTVAGSLSPGLTAFLAAGPAPLVFTLGTFVVGDAAAFYDKAATIARRLDMRAVLLTGQDTHPFEDRGVFRCAYASHSRLFPSAAAIIHHGGIGTTGQAMFSGKPQLVVPHMGDQYDHAHRIRRLGAGMILSARRFTVERGLAKISALIADRSFGRRSAEIAVAVARENGALAAAEAIERALADGTTPRSLKATHP